MFNKYYKPEEVKNMPYMYGLTLWGGFFNSDNVAVHNMLPALFEKTLFFENKSVRDNLLTSLKLIETNMKEKGYEKCTLMSVVSEGYSIATPVVCHRVSEYKGKRVHTQQAMQPGTTLQHAMYYMDNKWYPNFNDYPFGYDDEVDEETGEPLHEDVYNSEDFKIIQEWVTGAFDLEDFQNSTRED